MWSVSLLDLFIRTQLNILGRHVYIDTARDMSLVRPGVRSDFQIDISLDVLSIISCAIMIISFSKLCVRSRKFGSLNEEISCVPFPFQEPQYKPLSMSCQHKFIAFADFLPHKGVDILLRHVHAAVDAVLRM